MSLQFNGRITLQVATLAFLSLTCAAAAQIPGPFEPGGRLTVVSGQPVPTADTVSATVWYGPYKGGDQVPVFFSGAWRPITITSGILDTVGLGLSGGSKWAANSQRDDFITTLNGVAPVHCSGPAWSTSNATTTARGLVQVNGIWVNGAAMACDTSASAQITCPQYQCTAVGSLSVGPTAGQLVAHVSSGQQRRWDVYNFYHQEPIVLAVTTDPNTVSYLPVNQYPTFQFWGPGAGDSNNKGFAFTGLPETVQAAYSQRGFLDTSSAGTGAYGFITCVGWNGTCAGTWGTVSSDAQGYPGGVAAGFSILASLSKKGSIGVNHADIMIAAAVNSPGTNLSAIYGNLVGPWPAYPDNGIRLDILYKG